MCTPICSYKCMGGFRADHLALGKTGETIAADYLRENSYKVYKQNVRLNHDEIDIIAFDPDEKTLVFAEVKTRKCRGSYSPLMNITFAKKKKLFRSMRRWIARNEYEENCRVDIVCVEGGRVTRHIKGICEERDCG